MSYTARVYDVIAKNPNLTRGELMALMPDSKQKETSFSSAIFNMVKNGRVSQAKDPVTGRLRFKIASGNASAPLVAGNTSRRSRNTTQVFDQLFNVAPVRNTDSSVAMAAALAEQVLDSHPELAKQLMRYISSSMS